MSRCSDEQWREFLSKLETLRSMWGAADAAGIERTTIYYRMRRDSFFRARVDAIRSTWKTRWRRRDEWRDWSTLSPSERG